MDNKKQIEFITRWIRNHPDATYAKDFAPKNPGYKRWEFVITKSNLKKKGVIKPAEKKEKPK